MTLKNNNMCIAFDVQRFSEIILANASDGTSNVNILKTLHKGTSWLKDKVNPFVNFIGKFFGKNTVGTAKIKDLATLISTFISLVDNTVAVIDYASETNPSKTKIGTKIDSILSNLITLGNTIKTLKTGKSTWFLPIVASGIALTANIISTNDGVSEDEKQKINKSYVTFLKTLGSDLVKQIFSDAVDSELKKIAVKDLDSILKNSKLFKEISKTLTKTFGVVLFFATGALNAIDKYKYSLQKYTDDGIPEDMAKYDARVDALATFVHDTASTYVKGADDVVFSGVLTFISWITGKEVSANDKNYIEVIADFFKNFNFKNTGTAKGDYIISYEDNEKVYSEGGDDEIRNFASNVTILAGTGNDTVFSNREWKNTKGDDKFKANSIKAGKGDDVIISYAVGDTIYGDEGKDKLVIYGTGASCRAYGGAGDDYIAVFGAKGNLVNGGLGNDIIILDGAKNATVEYGAGDGNDIIYGYDESDRLQITGKYQMTTVGSSIVLNVGNGAITLDSAYGKTININGKKIKTVEDKTKLIDLVATIPSVWNDDVKIIRGTSKNDDIDNTVDDVIIEALSGDDYISNPIGNNITISGGAGNDSVYNGGDSIIIEGDSGADTIDNYGDKVKIFGGADNDSIENGNYYYRKRGGSNLTIDGGTGNDSIRNENGDKATIIGGEGNDNIYNFYGDKVKINGSEGNDIIYNYNSNSVTIDGENGNDYITVDECSKVSINGGKGEDCIHIGSNSGKPLNHYVTISSGSGNDEIEIYNGDNISVDSGDGNDYISNWWARSLTKIKCNSGNDYVMNYSSSNVSISGGNGNDSIVNTDSSHTTIIGGKGNDNITLGSYGEYTEHYNIIQYSSGDGNDIIQGFNEADTLHITKGSHSVKVSGNDVIVKVGKGSIKLTGAEGRQISIKDYKGKVTTQNYSQSSSANIAELFEENNFATANNLSEIVKNNSMATDYNVETNNFNCLTQNDTILTYSSSNSY